MGVKQEPLVDGAGLDLSPLDDFAAYVPLRVAVLQRLKSAIVDGTLQPGLLLSENAIASRLSVSRTPVREAIRVLEQEGLVSILPGRKVIVSMPTAQDIREIYDIRLILETEALRRIAARQSDLIPQLRQSVERQRAALAQEDLADLRKMNAQFHKLITSSLCNNRLEQLLETVHDSVSRFRLYSLEQEGWAEKGVAEHDQLISFLEEGDVEGATSLLKQHLKTAQKILEHRFWKGGENENAN
jgi:DNA-binding GntR family transcriptional regulator